MSPAINVQSSVTKRFYQEVAISDKQSIWRFEFRCAAAQKLRFVCKRAFKLSFLSFFLSSEYLQDTTNLHTHIAPNLRRSFNLITSKLTPYLIYV